MKPPPFIFCAAIILAKFIYGLDYDYDYVVEGEETSVKEIPFIALTRVGSLCTGSLISSKWVLTAAHCTQMIKHDNEQEINSCLRRTRKRKFHYCELTHSLCKCKELGDGSIEYSFYHDRMFHVWLGVENKRDIGRKYWVPNGIEEHQIKRIIRHYSI